MWNRPRVPARFALAASCWLVCAWLAGPAAAVDLKPDPKPDVKAANPADSRQEAIDAAAAMERARRLAANPLRVIVEAGKLRRRVTADPDIALPTGAATASPGLASASAQGVSGPVPVNLQPTPIAVPAASLNPSPTLAPGRSEDAGSAAAAARPVANPLRTLSSAPFVGSLAGAMPALSATDPLALSAALAIATMAPLTSADAAPRVTPRLIDMFEPAIPPAVLDGLSRAVQVDADLTLRPDGSVARVVLVPPVNRSLARYVVAALERWRFAPLPAEQLHRVQLVFNEGP